jgi:16S rRNA (cytidine1402-2'-O)-methyltransferase
VSTIYTIPIIIHPEGLHHIPSHTLTIVESCEVFFCEEIKTARRFIKSLSKSYDIDSRQWFVIDKHNMAATIAAFKEQLKKPVNIGIMSESGCPAIADPGAALVAIAQQQGIAVVPITGPSSIQLALMASGCNGQRFLFEGYLPITPAERKRKLQQLETFSKQHDCTVIFIETPYRNVPLFETILQSCQPQTLLCIASDITAPTEFIKTKAIAAWHGLQPPIQKINTIFLLYAG